MRRLLLSVTAVCLLSTARLDAQPSLTLVWDMVGETPTTAQTNIYRYFLDGGAGIILNGVLCVASAQQVTVCSAVIPPPAIGIHTVEVNAENAYGVSDKSTAVTFKYPAVPPTPLNLRVVKSSESS